MMLWMNKDARIYPIERYISDVVCLICVRNCDLMLCAHTQQAYNQHRLVLSLLFFDSEIGTPLIVASVKSYTYYAAN